MTEWVTRSGSCPSPLYLAAIASPLYQFAILALSRASYTHAAPASLLYNIRAAGILPATAVCRAAAFRLCCCSLLRLLAASLCLAYVRATYYCPVCRLYNPKHHRLWQALFKTCLSIAALVPQQTPYVLSRAYLYITPSTIISVPFLIDLF